MSRICRRSRVAEKRNCPNLGRGVEQVSRVRTAFRAEDGLEYGGACGVGDVHGVELLAQSVIGGGVAAAAGAGGVGGAEFERRVERHRRPGVGA